MVYETDNICSIPYFIYKKREYIISLAYFNVVQTSVSLFSILLAFSVSAIIGIVFGWYTTRSASKLNPIDAL